MNARIQPTDADDDDRPATPHSLDTRSPHRSRLPPSINNQDAGHATVELASIMTVVSNPVSPGASSPPLEQVHPQDFIPPTRPSSTPFPHPTEPHRDGLRCLRRPTNSGLADGHVGEASIYEEAERSTNDVMNDPADRMDVDGEGTDSADSVDSPYLAPASEAMALTPSLFPICTINDLQESPLDPDFDLSVALPRPSRYRQFLFLHHLPIELQELILDRVFDGRVSPLSKSCPDKRLTRLACISPVWRALIQQRLYCRIKLKATGTTLSDALTHFARSPHLQSYVKHVELWFPVFEPKAKPPALSATSMLPTVTHEGLTNASYILPSDNCSLEEAFYFAGATFPELSVLTLEGGERKKAPQVQHFMADSLMPRAIPPITTVRTLLVKGQWNLIRAEEDFHNIASALPNLQEWHGSYSKPKSKSYLTMASILPHLPTNLTSLDLCLEGDYRQEISFPAYFLKVTDKVHFCSRLAEATPALQHLSYTGRVCRAFFDVAAHLADPRSTMLKSVDLTVKNCCRHVTHWHESGSGITDLNFIRAFEALVLSAVRSMARLKKLEALRIRYVDLEFPIPPLNPFFLVRDGWASGVWSDTIVAELNRVRPETRWVELSDSFGEMTIGKDGRMVINPEFPKKRVVSLKLSNYAFLAALATM